MVQTADGSPEEGASRNGDDMSNPMWAQIIRLLDDEEQAVGVFKWPAMRGSKGMHHLPDCVKEYFTSATDAAEADPKARRATTTTTNCR